MDEGQTPEVPAQTLRQLLTAAHAATAHWLKQRPAKAQAYWADVCRPRGYPQVPPPLAPASELPPRGRRGFIHSGRLAAFAAGGVVAVGVAGMVLLLVPLPMWDNESSRIGDRLPVVGTIAAAVALAAGAFIAWRQRQEVQAADRFTSALNLLEDSGVVPRAAGVRALGALAAEVPSWQPDTVDTLCDFIRFRSAALEAKIHSSGSRLLDVEAAMVELARRERFQDGHARKQLKLNGAHLPGFSAARLIARGVDLEGANLRGANLRGADFRDATLVKADLQGANLVGADLGGADMRGAKLQGADLMGATLVRADLRGAKLEHVDLKGADLRAVDLRRVTLENTALVNADFRGARLTEVTVRGCDLRGANFRGTNLYMADLQGADLQGADLQGLSLEGGSLQGSNLRWADLRRARLMYSDLRETDLVGADLRYAQLDGTLLVAATCSNNTKWPPRFRPVDHRMIYYPTPPSRSLRFY